MPDATPEGQGWAHSAEAEQSLLGALLVDREAFQAISGSIDSEDFYTEDHAAIFRAIAALRQRGEIADMVTVCDYLGRVSPEILQRAGGAVYLAQLAQNTVGAFNINRYAELVRERALSRRLHALGQDMALAARSPGARGVAELALEARARISDFATRACGRQQIRAMTVSELLDVELPELEVLLSPWLSQKNLCMVHARRGVGKTHLAMACAYAIASGGKYLGWGAPKQRDVLYVDGEMPLQVMRRRFRELASGNGELPDSLRVVTPDIQDKPMFDLATRAGQAELDALVRDETALIVLDNLSCLVRSGGAENESESWTAVSEWALKHRRGGRAVLFIHHSGKTGAQRGTSKREDLLDVVINLRRPPEYDEADGAVFDIYFEKARSLTGYEIEPVRAKLEQLAGGGYSWTYGPVKSATQDRIVSLWEAGGVTSIDIARELDVNKSHVHRTLERAMREGRLQRDYPAKRRKASDA